MWACILNPNNKLMNPIWPFKIDSRHGLMGIGFVFDQFDWFRLGGFNLLYFFQGVFLHTRWECMLRSVSAMLFPYFKFYYVAADGCFRLGDGRHESCGMKTQRKIRMQISSPCAKRKPNWGNITLLIKIVWIMWLNNFGSIQSDSQL